MDWIKQTRERQAFLDTSRTPSVIELPHLLELVAINAQLRIAQGEWTIEVSPLLLLPPITRSLADYSTGAR